MYKVSIIFRKFLLLVRRRERIFIQNYFPPGVSMDDYIQEVNILKGDKLVRLHDLHYLLTLSNLFRRIMLLYGAFILLEIRFLCIILFHEI